MEFYKNPFDNNVLRAVKCEQGKEDELVAFLGGKEWKSNKEFDVIIETIGCMYFLSYGEYAVIHDSGYIQLFTADDMKKASKIYKISKE